MATNNSINAPFPFTPEEGGTGTDISNPASSFTVGATQATLNPFYAGGTFTVLNTAASPFPGFISQIIGDAGNVGASCWISGYSGTHDNQVYNNVIASRGSIASPTAIQSGDVLFHQQVLGQFGTALDNYANAASIKYVAEGAFNSSTNHPTRIEFHTANTGDAQDVLRVKIDKTGLLSALYGISTTSLSMTGLLSTSFGVSTPFLNTSSLSMAAAVCETATGVTTTTTVNTAKATTGAKIFLTLVDVAGTPTTASSVVANNIVDGVSFDIVVTLGAGATSVDVNWFIVNP